MAMEIPCFYHQKIQRYLHMFYTFYVQIKFSDKTKLELPNIQTFIYFEEA